MKNTIKNNKGFTLVEILIAAALVAGLSTAMMNIFKQQNVAQKKTETSFELSTMVQAMNTTLLDSRACTFTLAPVPNIKTATSIAQIRTLTNQVAFQSGSTYNNLVRIQSMALRNASILPAVIPPGTKGFGEVELVVTFDKISKIINMPVTTSTQTFKLRVEVDSSFRVTNCFSALESAVETAKILVCENIGGVYKQPIDKCELVTYAAPIEKYNAVSTEYLRDFFNALINPIFVKRAGDTMTGQLTMQNASLRVDSAPITFVNAPVNMSGANFALSNGNFTQTNGFITTSMYVSVSDKRLKKEIKPITNQSKKIYDVKTYEFVWKDSERRDYGFIAQEIEKIFPELVLTNPETGYKGVQYVSMVPLLLEEVKTLKKENDRLKKENAQMRNDILKIKKHLNLD